jgi:hypothetical protein
VRYRFVPEAGEHDLDAAALKTRDSNYLQTEIPSAARQGASAFQPVRPGLRAGDAIEDPAIAWPANRKLVKLGVATLTGVASRTRQPQTRRRCSCRETGKRNAGRHASMAARRRHCLKAVSRRHCFVPNSGVAPRRFDSDIT